MQRSGYRCIIPFFCLRISEHRLKTDNSNVIVACSTSGLFSYPWFITRPSWERNFQGLIRSIITKIVRTSEKTVRMIQNPRPRLPNSEFLRFQQAISQKRLKAHEIHPTETNTDLLSTYLWNIALSEAIYPVLHNFEIAVRNNFYNAISRSFHEDWLHKVDSEILSEKEVDIIKAAIENLKKNDKNISKDNLISELNLGFWIALSYSKYERPNKLYPKLFRDSEFFPHLPKASRTRSTLSDRLTSIVKLRNRIFHHNLICKDKDLEEKHNGALEVIQWISPMLYEMTKISSRFPEVYSQGRIDAKEAAQRMSEKYLQL
jgi:Abi-like protein